MKWEILQKTIGFKVENVDEIVTTLIAGFYRFLIYNHDGEEMVDVEENDVTQGEIENQS